MHSLEVVYGYDEGNLIILKKTTCGALQDERMVLVIPPVNLYIPVNIFWHNHTHTPKVFIT
jgi:hypothetical protein